VLIEAEDFDLTALALLTIDKDDEYKDDELSDSDEEDNLGAETQAMYEQAGNLSAVNKGGSKVADEASRPNAMTTIVEDEADESPQEPTIPAALSKAPEARIEAEHLTSFKQIPVEGENQNESKETDLPFENASAPANTTLPSVQNNELNAGASPETKHNSRNFSIAGKSLADIEAGIAGAGDHKYSFLTKRK
jgi:hypothetical protein